MLELPYQKYSPTGSINMGQSREPIHPPGLSRLFSSNINDEILSSQLLKGTTSKLDTEICSNFHREWTDPGPRTAEIVARHWFIEHSDSIV